MRRKIPHGGGSGVTVIIAKFFLLVLSFPSLCLSSLYLPFEGEIKDRKRRENEKKKERERNSFANVSLDLNFENILKLLASVLKYLREKWRDGIRSSVRGSTVPGAFTRGNQTKIEFMPFALPKYCLRIYSKSKNAQRIMLVQCKCKDVCF